MKILRRIIKYILILLGILVTLDVATLAFFSLYHPQIKKSDAIIILGAAINTPTLYNRSLEGLSLYEQGKADVIVVSGGRISDEDISEAAYMKKVIDKNSGGKIVPVVLEDQSGTTYENLKNTKAKLPQAKSVIIVSDKFHLARGVLMAVREGYYPVYWAAPATHYSFSEWCYYYFREGVALIDYVPKFLWN